MSITGPCRVCGVRMTAPNLGGLLCGPACSSLQAHRQAARQSNAKPGDVDYHPENEVQRGLHRAASKKRSREGGSMN